MSCSPTRLLPTLLALVAGLSTAQADLRDHLPTAWSVAESRMADTVAFLPNTGTYTRVGNTSTGNWNTVSSSNWKWHSGFWPGQLWLLSQKTGSATWDQRAEDWSDAIGQAAIANTIIRNHDVGFVVLNSVGKGWLANDDISDPGSTYRDFAESAILGGAAILNNRFDQGDVPVGMTKSWDSIERPYPVCVDNLMNLELMLLAYEMGGPQEYFDNALTHARTSIARHMRADGSTYHVIRHRDSDPEPEETWEKGDIRRKSTRQGFGDESTWTRGQAWAIHGLTTVYRYALRNGDPDPSDILAAAEAATDYFIAELPNNTSDTYNQRAGDFVPPSDFDAARGEPEGPWNDANNNSIPNETAETEDPEKPSSGVDGKGRTFVDDRYLGMETFTLRDSSAAAIAASGMLELSEVTRDAAKAALYRSTAEAILESLITYDSDDAGADPDYLNTVGQTGNPGILNLGSEAWGGSNKALSYGDMYFLEALARYEAITARELLETSRVVDTSGIAPAFVFERHEPAPALMWRIERRTSLGSEDWTAVAWKTGTGSWSGPMAVTEVDLGNGKVRVSLIELGLVPDSAFYRVVTLSAAGGI